MDAQLRRTYLTALGIALASVAVSLAWRDSRVTVGVAAGVALAVVPLASWHLIVGLGSERMGRKRPLVLMLVAAKYVVLAGAMWLLFRYRMVNEYGVGAGLVAGSMAVLGALTVRPTRKN